MKTKDARSLSPESQQDLRGRVARAIQEGMSQAEAARTFHVGKTSVWKWCKAYERGGEEALVSKKRGRPPKGRLKGHQAATIVRLITDRCPDQLKLPFALWTREAVGELIKRRCHITLSVWTVGRYLKRWGLTPQKPIRRAYEQNPEAVKRWLTKEYPRIRARAKRENAEIHWGDEMGMRSDHQSGTTYGRKGHTPVVPATGQRFSCNMISTITNKGRLVFMLFKERFTADVFLRFCQRLIRQVTRKVFLIVDGHPVHKACKVKAWLKEHESRLRLFLLPSYSPELNPDELLNQDVKSNAVGRQRPRDRDEMIANIRGYLRGTQRRPDIVCAYFQESNVAYAAHK